MAMTVAQLLVRVNADTKSAEAGLGGLAKMLMPGGLVGLGAAAGVAAIAGLGVASVKMAGDFQAGMTSLVTGAGESKDNLKLVSDGILKMAVDTGTSTSQLTAGMYMIESAGYHGKAGLDILKASAQGAKVGNADLGTVADATTTILKDFGASGITASGAVNELVATVASGKTHMADLSASLAMVLPTASAAGVGLNGVMAAMATMTGEGVPAADAATYLRQTMIALEAPGKQAQKALANVGLTTDQVAAAMHKSLPDALKLITDHLAQKFPVGSAAYVAAVKDVAGGSKQMQGLLDLTGGHMKDFQANMAGIAGAVKKGGSSIQGWGDVQGDFNQKMDKLRAVFETLMIKVGTGLLPILGRVADFFSAVLPPAVNAAGNVISWISGHFDALKPILGGIAAGILVVVATAIPPLIAGFVAWAAAAATAAIATLAAAWPVLAVAAAIGLLVAGIIYAYQHWAGFRQAVQFVRAELMIFFERVKVAVAALVVWWKAHWGQISGALSAAWDGIKGVVKIGWDYLSGIIKIGLDILTGKWGNVWGDIKKMLSNIWRDMQQATHGAVGKLVDGIVGFFKSLPAKLTQFGKDMIQGLINGITGMAGNVAGALGGVLHGAAAGLHIPGFATGGTMGETGLAVVGERGPELVKLPGGSQVAPLPNAGALTSGAGVSGLPAGMAPVYGLARATSGGQPVQVSVYLDGRHVAEVVTKHQPSVIRGMTGDRRF